MTCSCPDYHSGLLRYRITIERVSYATDALGGRTPTWAEDPAGGVLAHWEVKKGDYRFTAEVFRDDRLATHVRVIAVIRFRGDANGAPYYHSGDRIIFRGRTYGVEAVIDPDGRQQWLEFALVEGEPS